MIIVAIIAIAYAWYITRGMHFIPDDKILLLNTNDDHILSAWYQYNTQPTFTFNIDEYELGARFLQHIYNIEVQSNLLILGSDISSQYSSITRSSLSTIYFPNTDCIFNLRDSIGKNMEIAVIYNDEIRAILRRNNTIDPSDLHAIAEGGLDIIARDYLKEVLKYRWNKINELNDPNVLNREGSFLYLQECTIPNVQTTNTSRGVRINLLCKDLEFETLIKRWKAYVPVIIGDSM
ncbi:Hypothetical protein HVR_LOCUS78 [uncultured virus]|nr:Hypothetical protein HVR_LOCUS78 [uncultured virus]